MFPSTGRSRISRQKAWVCRSLQSSTGSCWTFSPRWHSLSLTFRRKSSLLPSKVLLLSGTGILAGVLIAIQSVLNAGLGQRAGNLCAVLMLTFVSAGGLILLILCFPATVSFKNLPGASEWYLYLGGILGIAILAAPSCWSQGSAPHRP